jgi:hypothetical protein
MATIYNTTTLTLDGNSQEMLPARPRRTFLTIANLSGTTYAYLSIQDAAVSGEGIALPPGSIMTREVNEPINEAIFGITNGVNVDIAIEERYDDAV